MRHEQPADVDAVGMVSPPSDDGVTVGAPLSVSGPVGTPASGSTLVAPASAETPASTATLT